MRVLVCVKQILDVRAAFDTAADGVLHQAQTSPVFVLNPADRCALEFAMELREKGTGREVVAVALGPDRVEEILVDCMARGVDRAVRINVPADASPDAFLVARELAALARELAPDLILCGTTSLDENSGTVGPAMAAVLDLPQVTGVVQAEVRDAFVSARRKLERGAREVVEAEFPCVLAVEPTMNEPRYLSRRRIWHARRRPIESRPSTEIGLAAAECLGVIVSIDPPRPRPKWMKKESSSTSSADKMNMMMGGAKPKKKAGDFVEGKTEVVVEEIVAFLQKEGILE
jgi:electron transfer flavoprotein beta subunit